MADVVRDLGFARELGGVVVVDKPSGMTSHDVVGRLRRYFGTRKVGHAGTLDPMATGVLVLGVGRATKLLGHVSLTTKTYEATIRLGASTTTDDAEGELVEARDASAITADEYLPHIATLTGEISQVPSSVSAVKVAGRRAYDRVRAGEDVSLPPREVTVSQFDVVGERREDEVVDLDVVVQCSSGTYIRALARDLGALLGVGGHLTRLRRTRVGPFAVEDAATLEALEAEPRLSLTLDEAIARAFPVRVVTQAEVSALQHGQWLEPVGIPDTHGAVDDDGRAWALLKENGKRSSPVFVARPANLSGSSSR
ncbi:tRNA pseudouridine(55) synthase TruB [Hoyosella rhizosphaerae]|uniref:tRNA pseudouridine synthase B n=1 Tax=Hoyosella rhizosphaerae TaxID=1755582 RepID=A0A916XBX4_9ACTN|nr:tRNA pseudouridine(55) synthase TruB [Hoyosella rhizosphaerae]MBN4926300.1 tRNA pseudouridine(55) synthase TruB [Hoyosella rhizosphaerae]GGC60428.1 tRNA pseudouridine synthase B [Hoyosella rhizosphaerae]